jgi:hypothetical protein
MQTEYYRPTSDLVTTISMALASCIGIATPHPEQRRDEIPARYTEMSPACVNSTETFYTAADGALDEAAQLAAFESFGRKLLGETVEPPQAVVDLLNERFWDLV